jgi:hypothetical protein
MSEPKGRLIAICMLIGAVAMIGLALSGTCKSQRSAPRWWLTSSQDD